MGHQEASFVNKNAPSGYAWPAVADQGGGDLVDDLNVGGEWGVMGDTPRYGGLAGWRRAPWNEANAEFSTRSERTLSLSHNEFLPRFETLNRDTGDMSPGDVTGIYLGNAKMPPIPPDDYDPRDSGNERGTRRKSKGVAPSRHGDAPGGFIKNIANATKPEIARMIESTEWESLPKISKLSKAYSNTAEHTPPYQTEVRPVRFLWAWLKVGYRQRYEATGVRGHIDQFSPILRILSYRASYRIATGYRKA